MECILLCILYRHSDTVATCLELSACVVISIMHAVLDFLKYNLDCVKLDHCEILVGGLIFSHVALFVKWE